ncbi:MAG: hypothetical protein KDA71_09105 [Planctomycetales bacterium]|nr:hypothetical protein [Planctomycetales bacterium]
MIVAELAANEGQKDQAVRASWGCLEYVPIVISPPLDFVGDISVAGSPPEWRFPNTTEAELAGFFHEAGLTNAEKDTLFRAVRHDSEATGLRLLPEPDVVRSLSSTARAHIYHRLGCSPLNPVHNNAFRFTGTTLEQWFDDANVATKTIELVAPYVYRNGSMLFFADWDLVFPEVTDTGERRRLVSALAREATVLMKLRIAPRMELDTILDYWGRGRHNKDIRPVLESLARCREGQVIDVVHLLPPFARRLLYTYPHPPRNDAETRRDCHWSSLNFFNEWPDDRFLDLDCVKETIETRYCRLNGQPGFGDLALFCEPHGEVFHSAIYIADNVVFTKNGSTMLRPWMFMRLPEMADFYPRTRPIEVRFYRRY